MVTLEAVTAAQGQRSRFIGCVLPEAASSSSSLKDTHFLSMAVSDWLTGIGGGVVLLAIPGRK